MRRQLLKQSSIIVHESLVRTQDSLERADGDATAAVNDKKSMISLGDADITSTIEANNAQGDPELVNVDEKPYFDAGQAQQKLAKD